MRAFILVLLCLFSATCFAKSTTWLGTTDDDFGNGANWTAGVPGTGDDAFIGAILMTSSLPNVKNGGTVGTLTLSNQLFISSGKTLVVETTATLNAGAQISGGAGTLQCNSALTVTSTVACDAIITLSGTLTVTGGNFLCQENVNVAATAVVDATGGGGTLEIANSATFTNNGNMKGNFQISGATLNLQGDGTKQTGAISLTLLNFLSHLTGVSANAAVAPTGSLTIVSTALGNQINVDSDIRFDGDLTLNASPADVLWFAPTGVNITANKSLTINSAAPNHRVRLEGNGTLTVGAGAICNVDCSNATSPLNDIALNVNFINAGTTTVTGGILQINNTVNSGKLIASAGSAIQANSFLLKSTGDLQGTFNMNGLHIALESPAAQTDDITLVLQANSSLTGLTGVSTVTAGSHITVQPTATSGQLDILGDLVSSGTFNFNANSTNGLLVNVVGGVTLTNMGTVNLNSSLTNKGVTIGGSGNFTNAASSLVNVDATQANCGITPSLFTNTGTTTVAHGILQINNTTNSGKLDASVSGAAFQSDSFLLTSTGDLKGTFNMHGLQIALQNTTSQTDDVTLVIQGSASLTGLTGISTVAAGSHFTVQPTAAAGQLDILGDLVSSGTFNFSANSTSGVNVNVVGGVTLTNKGTVNLTSFTGKSAQISGAGNFTNAASSGVIVDDSALANCIINPTLFTNNGTTIVQHGILVVNNTNNGGLIDSSAVGAAVQSAGFTITSTNRLQGNFNLNTTVVDLEGNGTQTDDLTLNLLGDSTLKSAGGASVAIAASCRLTVNASTYGQFELGSDFVCNGAMTLNASSTNGILLQNVGYALTINQSLALNTAATNHGITIGNGTGGSLNIATGATMTVDASQASCTINPTGGLNNAGTTTITGGALVLNSATNSGTMTCSAGGSAQPSTGTFTSTGHYIGSMTLNSATLDLNNESDAMTITLLAFSGFKSTSGTAIASGGSVTVVPAAGNQINCSSGFTCNGTLNFNPTAASGLLIDLGGNTLTVGGTFNVNSGTGHNCTVQAGTLAVTSTGKLASSAGSGTNLINMTVTNAGTIATTSGILQVADPLTNSITGTVNLNGGNLEIGGGNGNLNSTGTVSGTGTIMGNLNNNSGGGVLPGNIVGTLTVTGNYVQTAGAALTLDVGGVAQFDQLSVSGSATLAGALNVTLVNGFVPAPNAAFTPAISFASRSGDFTAFNASIPVNSTYFLRAYTSATTLALTAKTFPAASGGSFKVTQGLSLSNTLAGTDANGDAITFSIATQPAHGAATVTNAATGAFTYTPDPAYFGSEAFTYTVSDGKVTSAAGTATITVVPKNLPMLGAITASENPTRTGLTVTFSVVATDPNGLPLTVTWDFGDATALVTGTTVTHSYGAEAIYTVKATADDTLVNASTTLSFQVFAPNSGADNVKNIDDGAPPIKNPLDGITIGLLSSDGGVIELNVDTSNLVRDTFAITTEFDGIFGRTATVAGARPVAKFTQPGVYVATASATDPVTGALIGKGRKTLVISQTETGIPPLFTAAPSSKAISKFNLKGNFSFPKTSAASAGKPDSVALTGTIMLAAGIDLTKSQQFSLGIGNIIDTVNLDTKGKATLPGSTGFVKKLAFRLPKPKKGATLTTAGQLATFTITISGTALSAAGFDTEGIAGTRLSSETALKSLPRSIQLAGLFAGAPYETQAPVLLKLDKTSQSGSIGGRSSN